jgi:hypothetical protein
MYWTDFTVPVLCSLNLLAQTHKLEFLVTANSGVISVGAFFLLILSYIFLLATLQKHLLGD